MDNRNQISTPQNPDLVTFTIKIDGNKIPEAYAVVKIEVEKEVNRIPTATIWIEDGNPSLEEFTVSNSAEFTPGNSIEIFAGYHSDEEVIFEGIIIKHSIKIRGGGSMLIVECKDKIFRSSLNRRNNYYYDARDSDIIGQIFQNYDIEIEVENTNYTYNELVQFSCTDWDFMISRAQVNGKVVICDDGKLSVCSPKTDGDTIETVVYGSTIMELDAEMDARHQSQQYSSTSWDPAIQDLVEVDSSQSAFNLNGNISPQELAEVGDIEKYKITHGGAVAEEAMQDWINARQAFMQLAKIRGRVSFQGIQSVKPNTLLNLKGVSDRFNGKLYVSGVRHVLSEGNWIVDAQFGLSQKWFVEEYSDINALPASGFLPSIQGLQIGIVTQIEGDPSGEEKLMVKIPIINNQEQGVWARLSLPDAGDNRGVVFRPEIEDEVIVGFINNDPNQAVILGAVHSSSKVSHLTPSDDNYMKGILTKEGLKLSFDDEKKTILIETPQGNKISLDEDSGSITINDENGNKVEMDSNGITLDSKGDVAIKASGDIKLEGTNIELMANAEFKADGGAGAEISSSAIAVLKGSLVQIN
jgi:Rhs element Vgr protein